MRIQELTPEISKSLGLKNEDGVLISMVNPNEPAEKGGLKSGDVILEFNGKKIKDVKSLQRTVAESAVESKAVVKVWRDKKIRSFTVKLGELEKYSSQEEKPEPKKDDPPSNEVEIDKVGLRFVAINNATRQKYNINKNISGVVISAVKRDSIAAKSGLNVGMVISQISQKNIETPDKAKEIFEDFIKRKADSILLQVYEGDFSRFLVLKLD